MPSTDEPEGGDASETPRDRVPIRSSDLPLLYVLLILHGAVMASLPVAAWFILRVLGNWPAERRPRLLVPALLGAVFLVEIALGWRLSRVRDRMKRASR